MARWQAIHPTMTKEEEARKLLHPGACRRCVDFLRKLVRVVDSKGKFRYTLVELTKDRLSCPRCQGSKRKEFLRA